MTKMIKCDRCGKVTDGTHLYNMGFASFYIGSIQQYSLGEDARIEGLDLCNSCQVTLDNLVNDFMKEKVKKGK